MHVSLIFLKINYLGKNKYLESSREGKDKKKKNKYCHVTYHKTNTWTFWGANPGLNAALRSSGMKMAVIVWPLLFLSCVVGPVRANLRCGLCVSSTSGVANCVLNVEPCVRIVSGTHIRDVFISSCGQKLFPESLFKYAKDKNGRLCRGKFIISFF